MFIGKGICECPNCGDSTWTGASTGPGETAQIACDGCGHVTSLVIHDRATADEDRDWFNEQSGPIVMVGLTDVQARHALQMVIQYANDTARPVALTKIADCIEEARATC